MSKTISTHPRTDESAESLEDEFRTLVQSFGPSLGRLAGVYELDRALRDDLVQEILVALWRGLARFRGESSLSTWVHRVAHNVALKHCRGQSRARARHVEYERDRRHSNPEVEPDPVGAREDQQSIERLQRRIAALPALDRQLIVLQLEGMDRSEIAEITGLSKSNISTRLSRVREKFAREFDPSRAAETKS